MCWCTITNKQPIVAWLRRCTQSHVSSAILRSSTCVDEQVKVVMVVVQEEEQQQQQQQQQQQMLLRRRQWRKNTMRRLFMKNSSGVKLRTKRQDVAGVPRYQRHTTPQSQLAFGNTTNTMRDAIMRRNDSHSSRAMILLAGTMQRGTATTTHASQCILGTLTTRIQCGADWSSLDDR